MRAQLARPESTLLGPDAYNQFFTMHGTTMMFLFAVPVMDAIGLYLVPLMIGARNVAFPKLNAYGYWVYLFGGVFLYVDVLPEHRTGYRLVQLRPARRAGVLAREAGGCLGADDHLHRDRRRSWPRSRSSSRSSRMRAPGMTLNRMPLFVWAMLVQAFMVLFAMPWIATASQFLAMDRLVAHPFLQPGRRWRRAALAAPVLVLRPPRGLHHPRCRRLASCRRSWPTFTRRPRLRLPRHGAVADRDGVPGVRALGTSHVRDRSARSSARASSPLRA